MTLPVLIVGAGFGGLCAAIELARQGEAVTVVEERDAVGGKARAVEVGGAVIDVGPTVLTMPWVFEELLGHPLDRIVSVSPIDRIARHRFVDGSVLDLFTSLDRSVDAVGAFAGSKSAHAYRRFAEYSQQIAETVREPFLRAQKPTLSSLLLGAHRLGFGALRRIDAHRTMWSALRDFFEDERLRALFGRYATYVGSSPLEAPATFNLIAHVERSGVLAVDGGISRLAAALGDHARSLGVKIILGARASNLVAENGQISSAEVTHADGGKELLRVRAVVLNADVATIAAGRFGEVASRAVHAPTRSSRSLSAMTWAIAGSAEGFELDHHNVFFGGDYERETRMLWEKRVLPDDPTVYVCAPAPDRFFLIVNAPPLATARDLDETEMNRCETTVFKRLKTAGLNLRMDACFRMTPHDFARLSPHTGGAIYGEAARGSLASLTRPGATTKVRGLYLAGGSVHPGPGVPMAALSGRLAAQAILGDRPSARRSPRTGIDGFTSTR